ncbi:hypothetical protein N7471_001920 [Penicillium samsonianum]|uniref:uncharacterized protein n=1 Tax=Penicillium samsonianum TaxID=1882272 RepID=UPI002547DFB4|nr:uncharacterized protein N7471_001920 [Penicillium samsonianum]KAJ6142467.1 hypothetical protein N7471_001920 [Penicillium samsonianum]
MHRFFKSDFFNFKFIRIFSTASYGGAEIWECHVAASDIANDDPESWHRAWLGQANKARALGDEAMRTGDRVSARRTFLRASNYYRASRYMFHDAPHAPDARVLPLALKVIDTFVQALPLGNGPAFAVSIPFEPYPLPGYLYLPPASKRLKQSVPLVISLGEADPIQEELYYVYAASGPDLGYSKNLGRGSCSDGRRPPCVPTGKWSSAECWTSSSVACASMGGYYALHAAAEPRIHACVYIDPFYDMWDFHDGHGHGRVRSRPGWKLDWPSGSLGMDTLVEMMKFTLRRPDGSSRLDDVKCPVFVSGATQSLYLEPEETLRVFNALEHLGDDRREMWIGRSPEEGGLLAKIGAIGLSV